MNCIAIVLMLISGAPEPILAPKWEKPIATYMDCTFDARNVYVCKP